MLQGMSNLYDRIDRMHALGPAFIDITWNAGGRLSNLTCEMVNQTQSVYGLETCMHLTCTGMPKEMVDNALQVRRFLNFWGYLLNCGRKHTSPDAKTSSP